jgi:adenine-specific DNA-methyltransferase
MTTGAARKLRIRRRFARENDVTLFLGDCRDFLQSIPDRSVQLVVTSPPYDVRKPYEKRRPFDQYLREQRDVIAECVRLLKPGGSLCWQVGHHVNGDAQVIPRAVSNFNCNRY